HLSLPGDQQEGRLFKLMMYARFLQAGTPERSRLGYIGNKFADKAEARFNSQGVKSGYTRLYGFQNSIVIDPQLLRGGDFEAIQDRSPQGVADFLNERYNIGAQPRGNEVFVDTLQDGFN